MWKKTSYRKIESIKPVKESVIVYGTTWCGMTQLVRRYLDRMDVQYKYYDLETDPEAADQLRWITGGYTNHPTVLIDGQALIQPDIDELAAALSESGYV